ncbi:ABC transporter substrate-binding protein [Pseudomonas amygdali pv. morsprunorum]|nr:ABC transporter substrate-binding protein [Pseudomonas amygdali pv. morsprunorum]
MGWKVFGRRDAPALEGQIVVPADSPIHSLSELVWCFTSTNENIVYAHLKPTRES